MLADEEQLIVFHRNFHALPLRRIDWRGNAELEARMDIAARALPTLPPVEPYTLADTEPVAAATSPSKKFRHLNPDEVA
jgi:hypothetical protein